MHKSVGGWDVLARWHSTYNSDMSYEWAGSWWLAGTNRGVQFSVRDRTGLRTGSVLFGLAKCWIWSSVRSRVGPVDQTDEPNLSKKKKIWEAGGTSRPCRIAGQEIARLKVGPDGSDAKKKFLGKRRHGQTVPHCWPAKCEWTVLIGPVRFGPGPVRSSVRPYLEFGLRSSPVRSWTDAHP